MTVIETLNRALRVEGRASSDFDLNPGFAAPEASALRPAGVLVGLIEGPGGPRVLLTKRSSRLAHHPGQIAFPGGKVDPGDDGPVGAALREAEEEVGLPRGAVVVAGEMPPHVTVSSFLVTPVLGWIRDDFHPVREVGEVEEIFTVPFAHVLDPANYVIQSRIWRGQARHYYAVPYGPYYIWGATARMLRGLADRLAS